MSGLSDALRSDVAAAVTAALAEHRPKYAVSYDEAAERLSCSTSTITKLVRDGHLKLVPNTRSITVGSLRRLAELPDPPITGDVHAALEALAS